MSETLRATPDNFNRAETDMYFAAMCGKAHSRSSIMRANRPT